MPPTRLDAVRRVNINPAVVEETLKVLRQFGTRNCEGLVLWVGEVKETTARVTVAIVPAQKAIKSEDGVGYFVDSTTLFDLNRTLASTGLRLIAQVHSHPREAYHSETDDRYAIVTSNGGLSLVVPNFGQAPSDPALWAIYQLRDGAWCEIDPDQAKSLVRVGESG